MTKPHCDNCDALIVDANPKRFVTVHPLGYQCVVGVTVRKEADQELCARCLQAAARAFADSLTPTVPSDARSAFSGGNL